MDNSLLTYRCKNSAVHGADGRHADGNIVALIGKNQIFVRCSDRDCRAWSVLTIDLPGINIDFRQAGVTQMVLPNRDVRFNSARAPVILEEIGADNE